MDTAVRAGSCVGSAVGMDTAVRAGSCVGNAAGMGAVRLLQVKRCGRLGLGPSSRLTVAVVFQGPEQFRAKSVRGPLRRSRTYGSFRAKVHEDHL